MNNEITVSNLDKVSSNNDESKANETNDGVDATDDQCTPEEVNTYCTNIFIQLFYFSWASFSLLIAHIV